MADRPKFVCFRFTEEENSALEAAALRRGVTKSDLIRLQLLEVTTPYLFPFHDPNQTDLFANSGTKTSGNIKENHK